MSEKFVLSLTEGHILSLACEGGVVAEDFAKTINNLKASGFNNDLIFKAIDSVFGLTSGMKHEFLGQSLLKYHAVPLYKQQVGVKLKELTDQQKQSEYQSRMGISRDYALRIQSVMNVMVTESKRVVSAEAEIQSKIETLTKQRQEVRSLFETKWAKLREYANANARIRKEHEASLFDSWLRMDADEKKLFNGEVSIFITARVNAMADIERNRIANDLSFQDMIAIVTRKLADTEDREYNEAISDLIERRDLAFLTEQLVREDFGIAGKDAAVQEGHAPAPHVPASAGTRGG